MLIHGRNGCNFTEIMDGLLRREPITRLVCVFFLPAHTAIYCADLHDMEASQRKQGWKGKEKNSGSFSLAKLLVGLIAHGAKK